MPPFAAIGFDLFNTLVRLDTALLPQAEIGGKTRPSTFPDLLALLADAGHAVGMEQLAMAAVRVSREQEDEKLCTGREFPASYRWAAVLVDLEIEPETALVNAIVERHMEVMCRAWDITPEDRDALARLAERYPVGLLSNFDHGPSARRLLERMGIADCFRYVGISDELGWRKPEARVFEDLLANLVVAADACLYVGDSVQFDIAGAHGVGMAAAWIANPAAEYNGEHTPAYRAANIAELERQLTNGAH